MKRSTLVQKQVLGLTSALTLLCNLMNDFSSSTIADDALALL